MTAASRRTILRGLATASLVTAPAVDAGIAAGADPIPALHAEKRRVVALINGGHHATEDEADALMDVWGKCDAQAIARSATTAAGAMASVEWVRDELMEFGFHPDQSLPSTQLVLALLNGAIGVLRQEGGAA